MEIGNEISHKIRSAIKAKLVELGAYVDEELPDYIMVMVANKKSQFQMSEDLGLFLGSNTEKFTTWLQGLLQKLQSITTDTAAAPSKLPEKVVQKPKSKEQVIAKDIPSKSKKHLHDDAKPKNHDSVDKIDTKKDRKRQKSETEIPEVLTIDTESDEANSKPPPKTESETAVSQSVTNDKQTVPTKQHVEPSKEDTVSVKAVEALVTSESISSIPSVSSSTSKVVGIGSTETALDSGIQVVEDDDLDLLLTENDELTEELEQEAAVVVSTNKKNDSKSNRVIREVSREPQRGTASIIVSRPLRDSSPPRVSRPKAVTSPIRQTVHRSAVVRAVEPRPLELHTRKRRGPVSVIGSVTHESEEEDGAYDPFNPAVGSVASVVRVTARKSSIPPKLQANKSLLLKAMTEAEKSVETTRRVAITPVKPFLRSEGRDRDRNRSRDRDQDRNHRDRNRDRDRERQGRSSSSSAASRDPGNPSMRLAQAGLRQAISQPGASRHSDPPVYIPTRKVQPAPRMDSSSSRRGIVSKSKREEAEQRAWLDKEEEVQPPRKLIKREKGAPPIVNFVIEAELEKEPDAGSRSPDVVPAVKIKQEPLSPKRVPVVEDTRVAAQPVKKSASAGVIDSRVVEYEPEMAPSPAEEVVSDSGSQGVPILLEDLDQDELLLDQDVIELTDSPPPVAPYVEDLRETMNKDKAKDKTRFVVTLDGVNSDSYEMEVVEGERFEEGMVISEAQAGLNQLQAATSFSAPQPKESPTVLSPPKIQPMNINLKDSDEEGEAMEAEPSPLRQAKMMERCKFWPACVNGAACDYHHPTVHCKTFPMCKFGEKCLYIHPNCRFDSKCARPDCPFTHSSRRSIPPAFQSPVPVYRTPPPPQPVPSPRSLTPPQCRFFPACSNLSCPFFHPKPCRFGLGCKNKGKGCPFYHPSLPSKDKLTWVPKAAASVAAAVAGVGAAK